MRKRRVAAAAFSLAGLTAVGLGQTGCSSTGGFHVPGMGRVFSPAPVAENPLVVPTQDFEAVWNKSVAVVDKYFDIASENRLSKTIITQPKVSATLLEPWSGDSVEVSDRLEASLQTIRRFAIIKIEPAPAGGYLVKVEVRKELEDMVKPDRQAAGRAVFNNEFPVNRAREIIGPVPVATGWIPRGRDQHLEQAILAGIRDAFYL
jgi:hypothetical protein